MGLKGIRKEDLSSGNLDRLIDELKKAVSNGDYKTVEDFAREFAGLVSGLEVKVTAEGKREIIIGSERANFDDLVKKIREPIEKAKHPDTPILMDDAKRAEYLKMFAEVDSTLSGLFKQHEMMDVLVQRGLTPETFEKRIQESNKQSEEKIQDYKKEIEKLAKTRSALVGKNDTTTGKKDFKTEVAGYAQAKIILEEIPNKLDRIKMLKEQVDKMNAEIADPTNSVTEGMYKDHIEVANREIAELKLAIKTNVGKVKSYSIPDVDLSDVEAAVADTPTKSFDDAKKAAEKALNGDGTIKSMDARIEERYKKMATEMVAKKDDLGLDAATVGKLSATPLDQKVVDDCLANLTKKIQTLQKAKKTEEILVVAREASAQTYKEKATRYIELGDKLEQVVQTDADGNIVPVMEQAKDASGNLLYLDDDGNTTTEKFKADGTTPNRPLEAPKLKAKDEAALLTDFDEAAKKAEIENSTEIKNMTTAAIEQLSFNERREVLKRLGRGGPVRRFFRALFRLNSSDPDIRKEVKTPEITTRKTDLLSEAKAGHIEAKTKPMIEEFINNGPIVNTLQRVYDSEKKSAAVHSRMQDGAFEVAKKHEDVNEELIDALDTAAMESTAVAYAFEVLGDAKLMALLKKKGIRVKEEEIKDVSKQETLSKIVDKTTGNMADPVVRNSNTPTHTDERE